MFSAVSRALLKGTAAALMSEGEALRSGLGRGSSRAMAQVQP